MPEREFVLRARPGYDIREAVRNPTFENAAIFEYERGYLKNIHPVTPTTLYMFSPVPPPEYYRREKLEGRTLAKLLPDGYFGTGASPFVQAVLKVLSAKGVMTFEEIYRGVVALRICPESKNWQTRIRRLVRWMAGRPSLLTYYRERGGRLHYREGVELVLDPPLVPFRPGVDPIDDQISSFVEQSGIASIDEIRSHIMERLRWLESPDYMEESLRLLERGGYIERTGSLYRHVRRVDRFLRK